MAKTKSTIGSLIDGIQTDLSNYSTQRSIPDIITFVESKEWLGLPYHPSNPINLYPMQKIMLKVFYKGTEGNENTVLTEEEIKLCKSVGLDNPERGDFVKKYESDVKFRELVLVWGRRCISENSILINPRDGSLNKIGDLWDKGIKKIDSWTYDKNNNKMIRTEDAEIIYQGERECFELVASSGHTIECTNNHPFLTPRGWAKLENLDIKKDKIAICEELYIQKDKNELENINDLIKNNNTDNTPFSFYKIKSIDFCGKKRTFDLSINSEDKNLHNFVAQGFIVHNSGKDFCVSIIATYEAMKLLECPGGDPYQMYEISSANTINILTVANSAPQSNLSFSEIRERIMNSPYFQDKFIKDGITAGAIYLLTPKDKQDNIEYKRRGMPLKKGSIGIIVGHSNSDTLLGMGCIVLILDEVASYKMTGSSSSGDRIYAALTPTVQTYVRKTYKLDEKGELLYDEHGQKIIKERMYDGKVVSISSPRGREGKFYELFKSAPDTPTRLAMQLATWYVTPTHTRESLRKDNNTLSEAEFNMEYGAEFSGIGVENFFTEEQVKSCFIGHKYQFRDLGEPGNVYFVHLDPASSSHNYALAVVHKEYFLDSQTSKINYRIIVDHIKYWAPVNKIINPDDIIEYVVSLKRRFHIGMVTYDQWSSIESTLKLRKASIPNKQTRFNHSYKNIIYRELEDLINTHRLFIPYEHTLYLEMVELQRKFMPIGFKVMHRIDGDGIKSDDIVDAVAGAAYMAIDSSASQLPSGRLAKLGNPMNNSVAWRNMQGGVYGVGSGQQVASFLERRASWPGYKR